MNARKFLLIFLCIVFCASAFLALNEYISLNRDYRESNELYSSYEKYVVLPSESDPDTSEVASLPLDGTSAPDGTSNPVTPNDPNSGYEHESISDTESAADSPSALQPSDNSAIFPKVDFDALSSVNSDVIGWIYVSGTNINYPIVKGNDNKEYLNILFNGETNRAGSIFMDHRNSGDFSDPNNIIYGHRLSSKTMFTALKEYKKQEFYDSHPSFVIVTPENNYEILIFSAYIANVNDSAWQLDFSDGEYEKWLREVSERSLFKTEVTPTPSDRVVTLSTCTYEFNNARFIVHGIITEET